MGNHPTLHTTAIPGLVVISLVLHTDERGWFKENWQRATMMRLGLPDFGPVQHNVAFNGRRGVTRGLHAEPWDKLVSVAVGSVFAAWVDLRPGPSHGAVVTLHLGPETAVFVPRGVANGYQTLEDGTVYSYLVNDHWRPGAPDGYSFVNLADEALGITWPIPLRGATLSDADLTHPSLVESRPAQPRRTIIIGAAGQLGRALGRLLPDALSLDRDALDITCPEAVRSFDWSGVGTIINASAYTAVDTAETPDGRRAAWTLNVDAVARLCRIAAEHRITLVHVSSDYVFDGTAREHDEEEPFSPLGVYGQTKAAADALVGQLARHYVVRTSWLVGDGPNFVRTMASLARRGVSPTVVADQYGRLTFADDLATGIAHLLQTQPPFGTYNLTNSGPVQSWADIAGEVFHFCGRAGSDVIPISTTDYQSQHPGRATAPRPMHSTLGLRKIESVGFSPALASERLASYLGSLPPTHTPTTDR